MSKKPSKKKEVPAVEAVERKEELVFNDVDSLGSDKVLEEPEPIADMPVKEYEDQGEDNPEGLKEMEDYNLRYESGNLTKEDLDSLTMDQIYKYADSHDLDYNKSALKADLIEDVLGSTESLLDEIINIRLSLDLQLEFSKLEFIGSKSIEESIFLSKAWLGKFLGYLGSENPYDVEVKVPSDIPPTAEKFDIDSRDFQLLKHEWQLLSPLDRTLRLRSDLSEILDLISKLDADSRESKICLTQSWVHCNQAIFHLGNVLSSIRNN